MAVTQWLKTSRQQYFFEQPNFCCSASTSIIHPSLLAGRVDVLFVFLCSAFIGLTQHRVVESVTDRVIHIASSLVHYHGEATHILSCKVR
jgi:hypothetical protein